MNPTTRPSPAACGGFTLIELMVVVAVLGVLAAVAIPQYLGYVASSKERATKSNFEIAVAAVRAEVARLDAGGTPAPDMVANLNAGNRKNPYDSSLPAFVLGAAAGAGDVAVSVQTVLGLGTGGTVTVTGLCMDASQQLVPIPAEVVTRE